MTDETTEIEQAATNSLARRLALEYIETTQYALRRYGHEATEPGTEHIETTPVAEISWRELSAVGADDPDRAYAISRKIRDAARDERRGLSRAAATIGADSTPMDMWRFGALREQLAKDWNPRNGIEEHLIECLAKAAWMQDYWSLKQVERLQSDSARDTREFDELRKKREWNYRYGPWIAPRLSDDDAQQRAATEIDRWHRIFVRTLRQLRDMRRYNVVINNAGQVNVADKQIVTG